MMKSFFKGFVYAFNGIVWALKYERNMRFHFALSVYMFAYLLIYDFFVLTNAEWTAIILSAAAVFACEMFNTAIEKTIDLVTKEKSHLAKIAKDVSAGAVLFSATASLAVGFTVLWQPDAFRAMFEYYKEHIYMLFVLIISLVVTFFYVFYGFKKQGRK